MKIVISLWLCIGLIFLTTAEPRIQQNRALAINNGNLNHPYLFLTVPRGRSGAFVQGFQVIEDNEDDNEDEIDNGQLNRRDIAPNGDDDNEDDAIDDDDDDDDDDDEPHNQNIHDDDDDDDDDEDDNENDNANKNMATVNKRKMQMQLQVNPNVRRLNGKDFMDTEPINDNLQLVMKNAKNTQMMVSREHAGALMVPDGIIEIEGQSVVDEKTGKTALLVPRAALDAVPDGSVVALMEKSTGDDAMEEERANRVFVRRRRKGARRNVRRRGGNKRRRGGNRRRRVTNKRRKNVRVIKSNRRRNVRRRGSRPVAFQG